MSEPADEALAELCAALAPAHLRHTAVLALWRLRAPLLMLGLDDTWGIHRTAVEHAFDALLPSPGAAARTDGAAGLAPLLADPPEGEPEDTLAEFQLEVLAELAQWPPDADPDAAHTERTLRLARDLSRHLDRLVEDSLWDHPAHRAHAHHLSTLPAGSPTGYHHARGVVVEAACHDLVTALPPGPDPLPATAAGREALALCEAFAAELTATLAWLKTLGR